MSLIVGRGRSSSLRGHSAASRQCMEHCVRCAQEHGRQRRERLAGGCDRPWRRRAREATKTSMPGDLGQIGTKPIEDAV